MTRIINTIIGIYFDVNLTSLLFLKIIMGNTDIAINPINRVGRILLDNIDNKKSNILLVILKNVLP